MNDKGKLDPLFSTDDKRLARLEKLIKTHFSKEGGLEAIFSGRGNSIEDADQDDLIEEHDNE